MGDTTTGGGGRHRPAPGLAGGRRRRPASRCSPGSTRSSSGSPRSQLRRERPDHTLQTTALVHEAFLRLVDQRGVDWRDRTHFFGLAAGMMRRVLVDHVSRPPGAEAQRPGRAPAGGRLRVRNPRRRGPRPRPRASALAESHPRQARVVEMRYFADLDVDEVAHCLDISAPTVKRDWQFARAWLNAELHDRRTRP